MQRSASKDTGNGQDEHFFRARKGRSFTQVKSSKKARDIEEYRNFKPTGPKITKAFPPINTPSQQV